MVHKYFFTLFFVSLYLALLQRPFQRIFSHLPLFTLGVYKPAHTMPGSHKPPITDDRGTALMSPVPPNAGCPRELPRYTILASDYTGRSAGGDAAFYVSHWKEIMVRSVAFALV